MIRWFQRVLWFIGCCVAVSPICVLISGYGAWWVCSYTVGIVFITVGSGYVSWKIFSNILCKDHSCYSVVNRFKCYLEDCLARVIVKKKVRLEGNVSTSLLSKEISDLVHSIHRCYVLFWVHHISPDHHISFQLKAMIEEVMRDIILNVKSSTSLSHFATGVIRLCVLHFRQYVRAVKKVRRVYNLQSISACVVHSDILLFYKPLHPAAKDSRRKAVYINQLTHLILQEYLPEDVVMCSLLFLSLRSIIAKNVFVALIDQLCDSDWLSKVFCSFLLNYHNAKDVMPTNGENGLSQINDHTNKGTQINQDAHNLDLLKCDDPFTGTDKPYATIVDASSEKVSVDVVPHSCVSNVESLLLYVRSSSQEIAPGDGNVKSISSALGALISTTAAPLLSDTPLDQIDMSENVNVTKMWESPDEEVKPLLPFAIPDKTKIHLSKQFSDEVVISDYKISMTRGLSDEHDDLFCIEINSKFTHPGVARSRSCNNLLEYSESNVILDIKSNDSSLGRFTSSCDNLVKHTQNQSHSLTTCLNQFNRKPQLKEMISCDKADVDLMSSQQRKYNLSLDERKAHGSSRIKFAPIVEKKSSLDSDCNEQTMFYSKDSGIGISPLPPDNLEIPAFPSSLSNCGFSWENQDLSPIYEESNSLATSIAKLKSLLNEREGRQSLSSLSSHGCSESEPKSAQSDPGRYSLEKSRFSFTHKDSSGSLASVKSMSSVDSTSGVQCDEELTEALELPLDGKVFLSICISSTEVQTELNGNQYTLYAIQYDAIYICELNSITSSEASVDNDSAVPKECETKMMLQTNSVKRRFREFLRLHAALETDPVLKLSVKGIKGPNKWLNLPFSKLDSSTIASRKQFLEKYLQALIQKSELNVSVPLKEFLAYNLDSSVTFVKKPLEINAPKLNKIWTRTVSEVFHTLKTALPSFEATEEQSSSGGTKFSACGADKAGAGDRAVSSIKEETFIQAYDLKLVITAEEKGCPIEEYLFTQLNNSNGDSPVDTAVEVQEVSPYYSSSSILTRLRAEHAQLPVLLKTGLGSKPEVDDIGIIIKPEYHKAEQISKQFSSDDSLQEESLSDSVPLTMAVIDAFVELISATSEDDVLTHESCINLFTAFAGHASNKWLESKLNEAVSEENIVALFQLFRQWLDQNSQAESDDLLEVTGETCTEDKLSECLDSVIPEIFWKILGCDTKKTCLALLTGFLRHPKVIEDVVLHVLEMFAAQALPGATLGS